MYRLSSRLHSSLRFGQPLHETCRDLLRKSG